MMRPTIKQARIGLGGEIFLVLMIKAAILYAIGNAFFSEPVAPHMLAPPEKIEQQFLAPRQDPNPLKDFSPQINKEAQDGTHR